MIDFDLNFPRYSEETPEVPIWCLTPHSNQLIHRFLVLRRFVKKRG